MSAMSSSSPSSSSRQSDLEIEAIIPKEFANAADKAEWNIPWKEVKLGRKLGEGAYGVVFEAEYAGLSVAAKKLKGAIAPDDVKEEFEREVETLKKLRHPTVLLFMGVTEDPSGNWYILSEFAKGGSLNEVLQKAEYVSWSRRTRYLEDIALALAYLHQNGCLHRDLKAENVLINSAGVCKVADFGLARMFGRNIAKAQLRSELQTTNGIGSLWWRAPEVDDPTKQYTGKVDIFSFGITAAEIITKGLPGDEIRLEATSQHPTEKLKWIFSPQKLFPLFDAHHCPKVLSELVVRCADCEPASRPDIVEVVNTVKPIHQQIRALEKELKTHCTPHYVRLAFPLFSVNMVKINQPLFVRMKDLFDALSKRLKNTVGKGLDEMAINFLKQERLSAYCEKQVIPQDATIAFLAWFSSLEALLLNPRITPLYKTGMVQGFCTKNDAIRLLKNTNGPSGAMIVRFSSRQGHFAITYRKPGPAISHALVQVSEYGVAAGSMVFPTFAAMLQSKPHYKFIYPDQPLSKWAEVNARLNEKFAMNNSTDTYEGDESAISVGAQQFSQFQKELLQTATQQDSNYLE